MRSSLVGFLWCVAITSSGCGAADKAHSDAGEDLSAALFDAGPVDLARALDARTPNLDANVDAGSYRDPTLQPFSSTSVWNLAIGSHATWGSASDADVAQLRGISGRVLAVTYGKPFYVGTDSDPLVTVVTIDKNYPVPAQQFHVPLSAQFTLWMDFFDRTQPDLFFSGYDCSFDNGTDVKGGVSCTLAALADVCSDGVQNLDGAGRYDWGIGTIRHWELEAGKIDHALRYATTTDVAKSWAAWNSAMVWPDDNEDFDGPRDGGYSGKVLFGSTIGIASIVDVSTLGLSTGGLLLAHTLQDHGAIMRDTTGGDNALAFYAEPQDENQPLIVQMRTDLAKIMPILTIMRNQGPNNINGGGTPRRPLVAPIDPAVCP